MARDEGVCRDSEGAAHSRSRPRPRARGSGDGGPSAHRSGSGCRCVAERPWASRAPGAVSKGPGASRNQMWPTSRRTSRSSRRMRFATPTPAPTCPAFHSLTEALRATQIAATLIRIPPRCDFEQGTGHTHDEIEELYLVARGKLTMRLGEEVCRWALVRSSAWPRRCLGRIATRATSPSSSGPSRARSRGIQGRRSTISGMRRPRARQHVGPD
jgi:hypothetical protein